MCGCMPTTQVAAVYSYFEVASGTTSGSVHFCCNAPSWTWKKVVHTFCRHKFCMHGVCALCMRYSFYNRGTLQWRELRPFVLPVIVKLPYPIARGHTMFHSLDCPLTASLTVVLMNWRCSGSNQDCSAAFNVGLEGWRTGHPQGFTSAPVSNEGSLWSVRDTPWNTRRRQGRCTSHSQRCWIHSLPLGTSFVLFKHTFVVDAISGLDFRMIFLKTLPQMLWKHILSLVGELYGFDQRGTAKIDSIPESCLVSRE